jgi:hypothetical protein
MYGELFFTVTEKEEDELLRKHAIDMIKINRGICQEFARMRYIFKASIIDAMYNNRILEFPVNRDSFYQENDDDYFSSDVPFYFGDPNYGDDLFADESSDEDGMPTVRHGDDDDDDDGIFSDETSDGDDEKATAPVRDHDVAMPSVGTQR